MFNEENSQRDVFIRKMEKKVKDKDLAEHLISFYEKQIEEMVVSLFLYHLNDTVCLNDDHLTKYSFLLKNDHYLEATHKNRLIKTRDISKFELFEESFNHYFNELKKDLEHNDKFKNIEEDKNEIIKEYHKTKELNNVKTSYLKLRKHFYISKIMDLNTIFFLGICFSLFYELGFSLVNLSIFILSTLSLMLLQSSGEFLEKNRFKFKVNKVLPKTFLKSLNFISSLYMILYLIVSIAVTFVAIGMIGAEAHTVFGFENEITSKIMIFIISGLASYWEFRKAVYNKRYFMFKKLEEMKTKDELYFFLKSFNKKTS